MSSQAEGARKRRGPLAIARRAFLLSAGAVGGGLLVGAGTVAWRLKQQADFVWPAKDGATSFGAWLKLTKDGRVEVAVPHQDMGQGIYALAVLLVSDGLGVSPSRVIPTQAPIHAVYANPVMLLDGLPLEGDGALTRGAQWTFEKILRAVGVQGTGGSTSTRNIVEPVRRAAASLRDLLARAAAERFGVAPGHISFVDGETLAPNGKRATFGELAEAAAKLAPREIALAPLGPGGMIGRGAPRIDVPPKALGRARYAIDARLPGQLYAAIRHAPRLGQKLKSAQLHRGLPQDAGGQLHRGLPQDAGGQIEPKPEGVRGLVQGADFYAIVATSTGVALAALDKTLAVWDDSGLNLSDSDIFAAFRSALDQGEAYQARWLMESAGDLTRASGKQVKASYRAPYLAHATMEPMNATVHVTDAGATIVAGNQSPQLARMAAASALGISDDKIEIVTPFLGGGFGRRADMNFVRKACEVARAFKGTPVQTIWSRPEDLRDDFYRPAALCDIEAKLDASGLPASLHYRIATPSITEQYLSRTLSFSKGGKDRTAVDGALCPWYGIANRRVEHCKVDPGVPVGFWRSVGFSLNCFFLECFIDELAEAAGATPLEYRSRLIAVADAAGPAKRAQRVLERMTRHDGANPLEAPRAGVKVGRGFSLTSPFHSFVGQCVDVEIKGAAIKVLRVHVVVDCGFAIDPPNVVAQVRSGVNFALSAALAGAVTLKNGAVQQTNFDSYPIISLADAPEISVDLIHKGDEIGGIGEIGVPGLAPALANAIFAAGGARQRATPFSIG